ncbi:MAG: DUF3826 domain-containing protein [Williamsia sp.]|nr:DUF3826 domain-containing protein [Williamsia sp.]
MKHRSFSLALLLTLVSAAFTNSVSAQQAASTNDQELAYTRTINERAAKIVAPLGISDSTKSNRVKKLVADQYRSLNEVHTYRNDQTKAVKSSGAAKESVDTQTKQLETEANAKLDELHAKYIAALSAELTPAQVDQVKDGMTYGVVHVTYKGYEDMIPSLTDKQKEQIMAWLVEAREHAMDAESSDKKHAWFGKYKGRINNYLSAAGYDITKEREGWQKRIAAAKAASGTRQP